MSQPVEVYPYPVIRQQPNNPTPKNGSFGPVFIVLAVIFVVSAVACVLGRLCNRRHHHIKEARHHHHHEHHPKDSKVQSHVLGPKEWETRQKPSLNTTDHHGDVEFGFGKRIPSANKWPNGGGIEKPPSHHDLNGGHRPEVRFADNQRPEVRFADNHRPERFADSM